MMNSIKAIFFITAVLFFSAEEMLAQSKASKYILSGNYAKAQPIIVEGLKKKPEDIGLHFDAARFYFFSDHKEHKLETAWMHITRCESLFQKIKDPKQLNKYAATGIRNYTIQLLKSQIEANAFLIADSADNAAQWEYFISKFSGAEKTNIAVVRRNDAAFKEAQQNFSYESFKEFMEKYPNAAQAHEAKKLYESLLYKNKTQAGTWQAYKEYLNKYPDSPYADEAQAQYELLLYKEKCVAGDMNSYINFVKDFAANRYVPQAEDSIYSLFISKGDVANYLQFVRQFPNNKNVREAWLQAYLLATAQFSFESVDSFSLKNPAFPLTDKLIEDKKLAAFNLFPFEENDLYGYKELLSGSISINPIYEEAATFSGRLAAVKPAGCDDECKYGYINRAGNMVIAAEFDEAGDFINGFAVVGKGNCEAGECKYGLINQTGKIVLPLEFDEVFDVAKEGLALVRQTGKGYGYANGAGKIILPMIYVDANSFSEGLAAVKVDSMWRFVDVNGNAVVAPLFTNAGKFSSGLAPVANAQNLWGYINTEGQFIIQPKYAFANAFEGDRAVVLLKEKNKKGLEITLEKIIDLKGNYVEQEKPKAPAGKKKPKK